MPIIVGDPGIIKKGTHKSFNKIPSTFSQYKTQKLHFAEVLISLAEYY